MNPNVMVVHKRRTRFYKDCAHPYESDEPSAFGYSRWRKWAEEHMKTHEHTRCPDCGLYVVCKSTLRMSAAQTVEDPE